MNEMSPLGTATLPESETRGWFVAQLKPNGFARARVNLQRQGFRTFMPMREQEAPRRATVLRPLFPGYIFVNFDADTTQWRVINNTFGVARLVMTRSDEPQAAPVPLMAALMARCGKNDVVMPPAMLDPGDKVRVIGGPFRDLVAEVERMTEQDRVSLLLNLMGRATRAELSIGQLEVLTG